MLGKNLRAIAAFALASLVVAGSAAAQGASPRPWYASGLESLGFKVLEKPGAVGDFSAEALEGAGVKLSQLKGKVVLLNFWATWCPPCRAEMPALDALWLKNKDKAFAIMGISVGEEAKTVRDFIAKNKYSYPIYLDRSGSLGARFGANSIPTTYVIDKQGRIIAGKVGGAAYDSAEAVALFAKLATQ